MIDFLTIEYLKSGNNRQREAYQTLMRHAVLEKLSEFSPVLVGTIPISIDISSSDLDIACCWTNKNAFYNHIKCNFGNETGFQISEMIINGHETIISSFILGNFEIEIFGQAIAVEKQYGYRHMLIEYKILEQQGEEFRKEILELKERGYKTEPAFALLLGLQGNPYEALLQLE
ncbi:DUF4269 domain-containing protein [Flavobacterium lindanitolerans]|uniref:DUF4269 domain-containing protein n=1 Tax=Flavobacterium lindanitolerans TaxID=428988 RepID=UPI0027B93FD2|nr:DUF4269 domain-containing protein [Flavobacterium lindanitolerans]